MSCSGFRGVWATKGSGGLGGLGDLGVQGCRGRAGFGGLQAQDVVGFRVWRMRLAQTPTQISTEANVNARRKRYILPSCINPAEFNNVKGSKGLNNSLFLLSVAAIIPQDPQETT